MALSDKINVTNEGQVGHDEAVFEYNLETKSLFYTRNNVCTEIPASNVIAAVKAGDGKHRLIYASDEGASDEVPVGDIKTIIASSLPERYIDEFRVRDFDSDHTIHVVISIASGTRQADTFYTTRLEPVLEAIGLAKHQHYSIHHTSSESTITELTTSTFIPAAQQGTTQTIILLSGDGGIVDIVNATFFSHSRSAKWESPTIALLPLGTGNALAHSSKVTADNTWGLSTLLRGITRPLPVFRATFSPGAVLLADEAQTKLPLHDNTIFGCVVISWGLHASLVADSDTPEYRKHGVKRFQMAGKENLFPEDGQGPHKYLGRVSLLKTDVWEELPRKEHGYILATFMNKLEKTFTISPASEPLDGQLRIIQFGSISGEDAMEIMMAAYQGGKHVDDPRVGYEAIDGLRISFNEDDADGRWRRVCIDGKIIMVERGGWVEVKKDDRHEGGVDMLCLERQ